MLAWIKKIRKPYVIVSGFDPTDNNRVGDPPDSDENKEDRINLYRVANKDGFLDRLRDDGYDIIIYRSTESTESIISNAMNLVSFINLLNSIKISENELIIAGASMGGLVVRYALTYMENNTIDHQTKLFVSIDSPQNGANIPLGFQFLIASLYNDLLPLINLLEITKFKVAKEKALDAVAAREMLLYHYTATQNNNANCSGSRILFLNNLNSIGNFPEQCRSIAISMGSGEGTNQGFEDGDPLLQKGPGFPFGELLLPGSNLHWEMYVNAVPDNYFKMIFKEQLSFKICVPVTIFVPWYPFIKIETQCLPLAPPIIDRLINVENTKPIDNAPGSFMNLHNPQIGDGMISQLLMINVHSLMEIWPNNFFLEQSNDCFIPSYSALALNSTSEHTNIKSYFSSNNNVFQVTDNQYANLGGDEISYFDLMYIENNNDHHIFDNDKIGVFSEEMLGFMKEQTSPDHLFVENRIVPQGKNITLEARNQITLGEDVDEYYFNNGKVEIYSQGSIEIFANESIVFKPGFHSMLDSHVLASLNIDDFCPFQSTRSQSSCVPLTKLEKNATINSNTESINLFNIISEAAKPILVYPNPTKDRIIILSNQNNNKVFVYSLEGTLLHEIEFDKKVNLRLLNKKPGIYVLKVIQGNGNILTELIIKQ